MKRLQNIGKKWLSYLVPLLVIFFILGLWEVLVKLFQVQKWILPPPSSIFESFWQGLGMFQSHTSQTLTETALGFGAAVLIGVLIATIIELSEWARISIYPLLVISQTIPIIAVAPLFLIWLGFGMLPKVVVVALVCFFPIAVNLADGYRMVDQDMVRLMSTMGASRTQIFRMVKLPAALPFFFSGLRIAGTYSVMAAVIGEWLGASKGLGIFMTLSSKSYNTARVFAIIFVISGISLGILLLIEIIARLTMPWYYREKNN